MTKARVGRLSRVHMPRKEAGARVHESLLLPLTFAIKLAAQLHSLCTSQISLTRLVNRHPLLILWVLKVLFVEKPTEVYVIYP